MTPERKLWRAVLYKLVIDFRETLKRVKRSKRLKDKEIHKRALMDLETLWNSVECEWFSDMSDFAGIHPDTIRSYIRALHVRYECRDLIKGYQ